MPNLGVPKEALDRVKRHALVHQEAGERAAQILLSDVSHARTIPDAVARIEQTGELRRGMGSPNQLASLSANPMDCSIERNLSRPT
jgi:hypothetical protein